MTPVTTPAPPAVDTPPRWLFTWLMVSLVSVLGCFYYILYKNTTCSPLMKVCLACKTPAGFLITSHNLPETTLRNVNTCWTVNSPMRDQDELHKSMSLFILKVKYWLWSQVSSDLFILFKYFCLTLKNGTFLYSLE